MDAIGRTSASSKAMTFSSSIWGSISTENVSPSSVTKVRFMLRRDARIERENWEGRRQTPAVASLIGDERSGHRRVEQICDTRSSFKFWVRSLLDHKFHWS